MERTLAQPAHALRLDAKRIAATSVAILVHVAVLMLLLMPTSVREAAVVEEQDIVVVPTIKQKPIEPIPVKPQEIKRVTQAVPKTPQLAVPDPPITPVDDSISPVDLYVPPLPALPSNTFDAVAVPTVFSQITADVAPVPPYPAMAIHRRLTGEVVLRIRVDARGEPVEVSIERSSGSSILDEAAAKFVKARWHFVPAMQDGKAVEALALLPIDFTLPR
jgi:protein TonB